MHRNNDCEKTAFVLKAGDAFDAIFDPHSIQIFLLFRLITLALLYLYFVLNWK
jgi:hypothetical protein